MKTKAIFILCLFIGLNLSAQLPIIVGASAACQGECHVYSAVDDLGGSIDVNNGLVWVFNGQASTGPTVTACFEEVGTNTVQIIELSTNTILNLYIIEVSASFQPDIIALSEAYCSASTGSCDQVCAYNTVTYTTEVTDPNATITWQVSGAESYIPNGNNVTVNWGAAGTGEVAVTVIPANDDLEFFAQCGMTGYASSSTSNDGVGFIYIQGPPLFYNISITGPGIDYTGNASQPLTTFDTLAVGSYFVVVSDPDETIVRTCNFSITEDDPTDNCEEPLAGLLERIPASDCSICDGQIYVAMQTGVAPFDIQWISNGTPVDDSEMCAGVNIMIVTDANGCFLQYTFLMGCNTPSCAGFNSICVDVLETPNAAFAATPEVVNETIEVCVGQNIFFENQSTGASIYTWDFGNSVSSAEFEPAYAYPSAGTYEVLLITRNDCYCSDSTSLTVIVAEAIAPEIDCAGTVCVGEEVTYTTTADCGLFIWNILGNGTIVDGGGLLNDFITVSWGAGPEGQIELLVGDCTGDFCQAPLVELIPIIDDNAEIKGPEKVCRNEEATYSITPFAGTAFTWSTSALGNITSGQGLSEVKVQWAADLSLTPQWVAVTYDNCYLGCGGSDTIWINILSEFYIEGPVEVCPDEATVFQAKEVVPSGASLLINWTVLDQSGVLLEQSSTPSDTYMIDWLYGTGNYTLLGEVDNPADFCVERYAIFVKVVEPTPAPLGMEGETTICPGEAYIYTVNSASPSFTYSWSVTNGSNSFVLSGATINVTWANTPPYTLQLSQTNTAGLPCSSPAINLNVEAISQIDLSGTNTVCQDDLALYSATDYDKLDYQWQIMPANAGSIITTLNDHEIQVQWHTPGNHQVVLDACGLNSTLNVAVLAKPNPAVLVDDVCPGQTTLAQTTTSYTSYAWYNELGNLITTAPTVNLNNGYYQVIVTDANGCSQNENFFIDELESPVVTISTPDFGDFCASGGSMTLYALESSVVLDYQWYFNAVPVGTNSSAYVANQEGTYQVIVTDGNGCTAASNSINLNCGIFVVVDCMADGAADFYNVAGSFCNESQYFNNSTNDIPNTWEWTFIDMASSVEVTSNVENPSHTWTSAGFNLVLFEATFPGIPPDTACFDLVYYFDTIPLAADFVVLEACYGAASVFTDLSTFIPQTSIAAWAWDFGDPASGASNTSTVQNPQHVYTTSGNYTVTLTVTDQSGCISERQQLISIPASPISTFDIPTVSCQGGSVAFTASGSFTNLSWNFGDPTSGAANQSNATTAYHAFNAPGIYTVSLTATNIYACTETLTQSITIQANSINGTIFVSPSNTLCEGDSAMLTAPFADTYLWSTGATEPSIFVHEVGTYLVTVYDADGCAYQPPSVAIEVIPPPFGQINAVQYDEYGQAVEFFYNNYETCFGEDVFLTVTNNTNYTYEWSNGESTTEISFTEEKDNLLEVGTHEISVTLTDLATGCTTEVGPFTITVHPVPENIQITSNPTEPICENTPTIISVSNPVPNYTYVWNNGAVGTSINTFYAGEYFVRAVNEFGCAGLSNSVNITPGPNINLIPEGCHSRCNPDEICLPNIPGVQSYQWYFNNSPIPAPQGNIPDLVATESGAYYVEMVGTAGCVSTSDVLTLDLYDGYGAVLGEVYFDINNNGVIDGADTLMNDIAIILQNNLGVNLDTLIASNQGSFSFSNILSTDYNLLVDEANLSAELVAIISQQNVELIGCEAEGNVAFLIQLNCQPMSSALDLPTCTGQTAEYNGTTLTLGEVQDFVLENSEGCDSMVTVTVVESMPATSQLSLEACTGTFAAYGDLQLPAGSVTEVTLADVDGCDSIVTVSVLALENDLTSLFLYACDGETVTYNGDELPAGISMTYQFLNQNNCDSTVNVFVLTHPQMDSTLELYACVGETILFNNIELAIGATETIVLLDENNCDSLVNVNVLAYPEMEYEALGAASCWNDNSGSIRVENLDGGTPPFDYSLDGINYQADDIFDALSGKDYLVYVRDANGCVKTEWVEIQIIEALEVQLESEAIPCDFSPVKLEAIVSNSGTQALNYLWDNGADLPFIEVDTPGIYTVQISNDCEDITKRFEVVLAEDIREDFFFVPNIFSPNGDGVNDNFQAFPAMDIEVLFFEMKLFDRWGNYLYAFKNVDDVWNGDFREKELDEGVYVWYYEATIRSCGRIRAVFDKGDLTIIR